MKTKIIFFIVAIISFSVHATSEFENVLYSFGILDTIAGKGLISSKEVNGWDASMEGAAATFAELSRPHMTMADTAGNLYIADKDAHAVRKVTPDGLIHTVAGTGTNGFNGDGVGTACQLGSPNGLFTFPDGTTFILDLDNSRIRRLDTSGVLTTIVHDTAGIIGGRGIWVSSNKTEIFYSSGFTIKKWSSAEGITNYATGFSFLGNIHVDPRDGNIVATDRDGHRVYKVFPDGSKVAIAGNGTSSGGGNGQLALSTGLDEVRAVFFTDYGGYYLGTHDGSQVWYVDTNNFIHLLIDGAKANTTHAGDGKLLTTPGQKVSEVRSVALSPNGDLLITENDRGYVRIVYAIPEPWIPVAFLFLFKFYRLNSRQTMN